MSQKQIPFITIGHGVSHHHAVVIISLDVERAILSAKGARQAATQLLDWAQHAEDWVAKTQEERDQEWLSFKNPPVEAMTRQWVEKGPEE